MVFTLALFSLTGILVLSLLSVGAAIVAGLLIPKQKQSLDNQDFVQTRSDRNAPIPLTWGRDEVSPLVAWMDEPVVVPEEQGGGGKGFGGGGGVSVNTYRITRVDIINCNTVSHIYKIKYGEEIIAENITRAGNPSGSSFNTDKGSFRIYWGEINQEADPTYSGAVNRGEPYGATIPTNRGIGMSGIAYIVWHRFDTGQTPNFDEMKYEIGCYCDDDLLSLEGTSAPRIFGLVSNPTGYNAGHLLYNILCLKPFRGAGLSPEKVDEDALVALAEIVDTEQLMLNFTYRDGQSIADVVQQMANDVGFSVFYKEGKLSFEAIRSVSNPPTLPEKAITQAVPETEDIVGENPVQRVTYFFSDKNLNYKRRDLKRDNDAALADSQIKYTEDEEELVSVNDVNSANVIAFRKELERFGEITKFDVTVMREMTTQYPAQSFIFGDNFYRIAEVTTPADLNGTRKISCFLDVYSTLTTTMDPEVPPGTDPLPVAGDVFVPLQMPCELTNGTIRVVILRARAHAQITEATIYHSFDNETSYSAISSNYPAVPAGTLESNISSLEASPIASITVSSLGPDLENVDTLSIAAWQAGEQLAVIDDEIFFCQGANVITEATWTASTAYTVGDYREPDDNDTGFIYECTTAGTSGTEEPDFPAVAGDTITDGTVVWTARYPRYTIEGLERAKYSSVATSHIAGANIFIFNPITLPIISHPSYNGLSNIYYKSVPRTRQELFDISSVTGLNIAMSSCETTGLEFYESGGRVPAEFYQSVLPTRDTIEARI